MTLYVTDDESGFTKAIESAGGTSKGAPSSAMVVHCGDSIIMYNPTKPNNGLLVRQAVYVKRYVANYVEDDPSFDYEGYFVEWVVGYAECAYKSKRRLKSPSWAFTLQNKKE